MELINKNKNFIKDLLNISIPIIIQNFISSSLNLIDNFMIGNLGDTAIAAVGLSNQFFFLYVLILFGVNSGTGIFVSQFLGKKDIKNIKKVLGISIIIGSIVSFVFMLLGLGFPNKIIKFFVKDNYVIDLGSKYLRIAVISYIFTAISFSYSFASRSIGKAKIPMITSIIALAINTSLNYILIFGKLGLPNLGVKGAAIATLISRIVELILLLVLIYKNNDVLNARIKEMIGFNYEFLKKYFKTTYPVIINEGLWALGMTMYMKAYGMIGTEAVTSVQISNTIQSIFMVVTFGVGNACGVMIGSSIGAEEYDVSFDYSKKFSIISSTLGFILGMLLIMFSPFIVKFYNITDEVYFNTLNIIKIMGLFMAIKMFNATLIIGILRGGGDTKYSMFLEITGVWLIGVPLAFIGAKFKLPINIVILLVYTEEIFKCIIGTKRIISKKWMKNVIRDILE